jgi:hypothetical protein
MDQSRVEICDTLTEQLCIHKKVKGTGIELVASCQGWQWAERFRAAEG